MAATSRCVACGRPLHDRRRKECEFCGTAIPQSLGLSARQRAIVEGVRAEEAREQGPFTDRAAAEASGRAGSAGPPAG